MQGYKILSNGQVIKKEQQARNRRNRGLSTDGSGLKWYVGHDKVTGDLVEIHNSTYAVFDNHPLTTVGSEVVDDPNPSSNNEPANMKQTLRMPDHTSTH
jgi:hypothetical protein